MFSRKQVWSSGRQGDKLGLRVEVLVSEKPRHPFTEKVRHFVFFFFFYSSPEDMFIDIREGEGGKGEKRKILM